MQTSQVMVLELTPQDVLEKRMMHINELVHLADAMGYSINGFMDENDLMRKMKEVELNLLTAVLYTKEHIDDEVEQLRTELKLEKFHAIACRILDALGKY